MIVKIVSIYLPISGFLLCSGVIIYAGSRLSVYGDRLAELSGLGKAWIGLVLMAAVTSLPELIVGISSVAVVKAPDLAAGDVFGSCVFNLLILSFLDALQKKPLTSLVRNTHVFAGACGIILIALSGAGIFLSKILPSIAWFSSLTPVLFTVYFFFVWLIFKFESKLPASEQEKPAAPGDAKALRKTITLYALHAAVVVCAALFLPYFGKQIAQFTGLGNTFFGTLFLAASTSLPELVVSIAALRIGSLDMAVGNLFGSNIFNIFILGVDDIFYREGALFNKIELSHLASILTVIVMTAVATIGLLLKPDRKRFFLAGDTFVILLLYFGLMVVLYIGS